MPWTLASTTRHPAQEPHPTHPRNVYGYHVRLGILDVPPTFPSGALLFRRVFRVLICFNKSATDGANSMTVLILDFSTRAHSLTQSGTLAWNFFVIERDLVNDKISISIFLSGNPSSLNSFILLKTHAFIIPVKGKNMNWICVESIIASSGGSCILGCIVAQYLGYSMYINLHLRL